MTKVLFVCLGNICRSPLAEALMNQMLEAEGLTNQVFVDSAGTGSWHVGEMPDERTFEVANRYGLKLENPARETRKDDLKNFDYILVMDHNNYDNVQKLEPNIDLKGQLFLTRDFDPEKTDPEVPDPYWGTEEEFEMIYGILKASVAGFVEHLKSEKNLIPHQS